MGNYRPHLNPDDMTPEERLDALAEVLAEGVLYLAENGLLDGKSQAMSDEANQNPGKLALTSGRTEGTPSFDGAGKADGD
ncbi:MAG: hypothetical protein HY549_06795 [Elusimicrobia bacterium]|nr:hypothetical protein [Elusimicrobiota bacterium]